MNPRVKAENAVKSAGQEADFRKFEDEMLDNIAIDYAPWDDRVAQLLLDARKDIHADLPETPKLEDLIYIYGGQEYGSQELFFGDHGDLKDDGDSQRNQTINQGDSLLEIGQAPELEMEQESGVGQEKYAGEEGVQSSEVGSHLLGQQSEDHPVLDSAVVGRSGYKAAVERPEHVVRGVDNMVAAKYSDQSTRSDYKREFSEYEADEASSTGRKTSLAGWTFKTAIFGGASLTTMIIAGGVAAAVVVGGLGYSVVSTMKNYDTTVEEDSSQRAISDPAGVEPTGTESKELLGESSPTTTSTIKTSPRARAVSLEELEKNKKKAGITATTNTGSDQGATQNGAASTDSTTDGTSGVTNAGTDGETTSRSTVPTASETNGSGVTGTTVTNGNNSDSADGSIVVDGTSAVTDGTDGTSEANSNGTNTVGGDNREAVSPPVQNQPMGEDTLQNLNDMLGHFFR